jgi:hypothetical protein
MRKRIALLALLVSTLTVCRAQNAAPPEGTQARRSLAITLLRAINTAEYDNKFKNGHFVDWDTLSESGLLDKALKLAAQKDPKVAGARFGKAPEILPGWHLRLNIHADGQGYDVMLEDVTDAACHYAAGSDERGVIRQSKTIDCDLQ